MENKLIVAVCGHPELYHSTIVQRQNKKREGHTPSLFTVLTLLDSSYQLYASQKREDLLSLNYDVSLHMSLGYSLFFFVIAVSLLLLMRL